MTTTISEEIVLHLPRPLVERLQAAADQRRQSLQAVVEDIVTSSVESLHIQANAQFDAAVNKLRDQDTRQLRESAKTTLLPTEKTRASKLIAKSKSGPLSEAERREQEELLDRVEQVAVTRAAALWLLQQQARKERPS